MKKITFLFLLLSVLSVTETFAQSDYYTCIPSDGSTSGNARAPHGRFRYQRGVILIKATEMTASGIVNTDVINSIAFNYLVAQDVVTNGTMTLYLQNTADVTNLKSTTWATAIAGMTTVSTGAVTVPNTVGNAIYNFSGGSPFTYTGGGVYVAFDYQNAANPLPATFATIDCNSTGLAGGYKGAQSDTAVATTVAASNFRPVILLGKQVTCARPYGFSASSQTTTSATLTFNATSPVNLEYGPYGFTPGTGTVINNVTSPYVLSGLSASSVYDVYGIKDCGAGNFSVRSDVFAFNTVFLPSDAPYNSGFEQESLDFIGWVTSPINFTSSWFINYGGLASPLVQEGLSSAVSLSNTTSVSDAWLFSRGVNLSAGSAVAITYYDRNYLAAGSTGTASYTVNVGTSPTVDPPATVLSTVNNIANTAFELKTVNYTTPADGVYYFSFHNLSPLNAGTQALIIDNFTVTQTLGVKDFLASKISVLPNPAKDLITISNDINATISTVVLTDLNGRVVKNQSLNAMQGQVAISDLSTGVYMVKVTTDQGTVTKKIVKE